MRSLNSKKEDSVKGAIRKRKEKKYENREV